MTAKARMRVVLNAIAKNHGTIAFSCQYDYDAFIQDVFKEQPEEVGQHYKVDHIPVIWDSKLCRWQTERRYR